METVTIERAEYDRLREAAEMLADVKAFDAAMAERGEGVPGHVVDAILDGQSPLRAFREWRGLSQNRLAALSGVNRVQIGDIEDRGKSGSVETLRKLADALGVTVDDLI